jgi:predicted alpha/beta superfamily hydrolase
MKLPLPAQLHLILAVALLSSANNGFAQQETCKSTVTGDLHIEHFDSLIFPGPHTLRVWLPPGYSDPANASRKYPILYMLDGQNMFDACSSMFHQEWNVDESLTQLIHDGRVEPIIVVGIDSPGNDDRRGNELLPVPDPGTNSMLEPQGRQFPAFLAREVMPRVAANYRVRTGRAFTGIGGSSYGAIAALYELMMHADMFGIGLLESPSLQVGNGEFVRSSEHMVEPPLRVYVGVGDNETGPFRDWIVNLGFDPDAFNRRFAAAAKQLSENLRQSGGDDISVKFVEASAATHTESAWQARFPAAATPPVLPARSQAIPEHIQTAPASHCL